jgi:hypothetical protein
MTQHGKQPTTSVPVDGSSNRDPVGSTAIPSLSSQELSSISADTAQRSADEQTSESTFAGEAVRQIEALVESFRTRQIKKLETIYRIGQILADESTGSERLKSDSLERYAATLEGIEAITAQSN